MADKKNTQHYVTRVSGFWNTRHAILKDGATIGTFEVHRNWLGLVSSGKYTPVKGETLVLRRDPGILRSQFSLWTEADEWLGSALRWSFFGRTIDVSTGSKPLLLIPLPGFRRGWRLMAPKSGELARICARPFSRAAIIDVHRRLDLEQVLFAYFLGVQLFTESFWPGPAEQGSGTSLAAAS